MGLNLGEVVEGKITGITKFGAFVSLPEGASGMVHISEIARTYVNDIREHLTEGQSVTVKVISVDEAGRINLSIKKALEPQDEPGGRAPAPRRAAGGSPRWGGKPAESGPKNLSFEDKLKQFMQDSESRMVDIKHQSDKRGGRSRRK